MNQFESSIIHAVKLHQGHTVTEHRTEGEGDNAVSLVRYSDGELYRFDNGSGMAIATVWGWERANTDGEPAWFLTRGQADDFGRSCGCIFGEPIAESADGIALGDILRIADRI
jgi:hypothetical protein